MPGFHKAVKRAAEAADAGYLVCFGITPSRAETGYGYIAAGGAIPDINGASHVAAFREKPDSETAEAYVAAGTYSWNSGMFLFKASVVLSEMRTFAPEMVQACEKALASTTRDLNFERFDPDLFAAIPADSIDYALMEKTDKAAVIAADIGWSDVGSFSALWNMGEGDSDGNVVEGDAVCINSKKHLYSF